MISDLNINFASFERPEGDFGNYKKFKTFFAEKNKNTRIPDTSLNDMAKHAWSAMQEDDENVSFSDDDISDDEISFNVKLPELCPNDPQESVDEILALNPILFIDATEDIADEILFGDQLRIDDYSAADDEEVISDYLVDDADDNYVGPINILSSYYTNLFTVISDYTVAISSDNVYPKDIKHATENVLYALILFEIKTKIT